MPTELSSPRIFPATVIPASGTATSPSIDLAKATSMALHLTSITGTSPNVTFTYKMSCDNITFVTPQTPVTIGANKTAVDIMAFAPQCARWMQIICTNNNGSNQVTIDARLAVQERN